MVSLSSATLLEMVFCMSLLAKLFNRIIPARSAPENSATRTLLSNETNKQILRESLERLEAAGLRICRSMDRDLIVVRSLLEVGRWSEGDDLAVWSAKSRNSLDLVAFWELASETNVFHDLEDIGAVLPKLSSLPADELDEHSHSIFENAASICIVNEHAPGEYLRQQVNDLEALACGDFAIKSIAESAEPDRLAGRIALDYGRSASFKLRDEKRPDVTPLFKAMNSLIAPSGNGRFAAVSTGSGEELIAVYLRPGEQIAFRAWEERQHCASGPAPVDWFD